MNLNVAEIFSSIQGEGAYAGVRQLFLRLAGCNLRCRYCDTPGTRSTPAAAVIEDAPASGKTLSLLNPLSSEQVMKALLRLYGTGYLHHSLSITGGEPLLQAEALLLLLPELRRQGVTIYLETNGTLPAAMRKVVSCVDIVAMDIKLQSAAGVKVPLTLHGEFIEAARQTDLFLKIVLTASTSRAEFLETMEWLASFAADIPLILQPVTPFGDIRGWVPPRMLLDFMDAASGKGLSNVRSIPQMHKLLGQP